MGGKCTSCARGGPVGDLNPGTYSTFNGTEVVNGKRCNKWVIQNAIMVKRLGNKRASERSTTILFILTKLFFLCPFPPCGLQASKVDALVSKPRVPARLCTISLTSTECQAESLLYEDFKFRISPTAFDLPACCNQAQPMRRSDYLHPRDVGLM